MTMDTNAPMQPALVIGVGAEGAGVCRELVRRQQVRAAFHAPLPGTTLPQKAPWAPEPGGGPFTLLTLPNVQLLYPAYSSAAQDAFLTLEGMHTEEEPRSAVAVREWYLEHGVKPLARRVSEAFNQVRADDINLFNDLLAATVYIVGATWSPMGAALLWPIAQLVREALGDWVDFQLIGIFLSAEYRLDSSGRGAAHSFVALTEGEVLLDPEIAPGWVHYNGGRTYDSVDTAYRWYDSLYLIDSLKANNSTLKTDNNAAALHTHAAAVLESLVFAPVAYHLDHTVLDDYLPVGQQFYIGVGSSTLVVPLAEIRDLVEKYALGTIIRDRVLRTSRALQNLAYESEQLLEEIRRDVQRQTLQEYNKALGVQGEFTVPLDLAQPPYLHVALPMRTRQDSWIPGLKKVDIRGPDPFAGGQELAVDLVLERLQEENETRHRILERLESAIEAPLYDGQVKKAFARFVEEATRLLQQGDDGLLLATEYLKEACQLLIEQSSRLRARLESIRGDPEFKARQEAVDGLERWYYNTERIRPIVRMKPYASALLLRAVMLFVIVYQFYWDGYIQNQIQFWPLGRLEQWPLSSLATYGRFWEYDLAARLWLLVFLLVLFLLGLPFIGARLVLNFHRRALAGLLRDELELLWESIALKKVTGILILLKSYRDELQRTLDGLEERAAEYTDDALGTAPPPQGYLEHWVVTPREVATPYRARVAELTISRLGERIIPNWFIRERLRESDEPRTLRSVDELLDLVRQGLDLAIEEVTAQPVDAYLKPEQYNEWARILWYSAAPWLRSDSSPTAWRDAEPVSCNFLIVGAAARAGFIAALDDIADYYHTLGWGDPYRLVMLRMRAGIPTYQIARYYEMAQAFRALSSEEQRTLTDSELILHEFAPLSRPPQTVGGQGNERRLSTARETTLMEAEPATALSIPTPDAGTLRQIASQLRWIPQWLEPFESTVRAGFDSIVRGLVQEAERVQVGDGTLYDFVSGSNGFSGLGEWQRILQLQPTEVQTALAPVQDGIERALAAAGVQAIRPQVGEPYDPHLYKGYPADPMSESNDTIVAVIRNGYRGPDGTLWLEPEVAVGG